MELKLLVKNLLILRLFNLRLFFILSLLIFSGCENNKFKKIYIQEKINFTSDLPKSLQVKTNDDFGLNICRNFFSKKGFVIGESDLLLDLEYRYYSQTCNNPLSKTSSDYDYDGFIKITLSQKSKKLYFIQIDFKGMIDEKIIVSLLEEMIDDIGGNK